MTGYSPFDKDIRSLEANDLQALKNVREGWFVEYKRELVNARALAKAVSAFANTYGGWLFIGIDQGDTSDPVADNFPGILETEVDAALQRLRQSTATRLNPEPFFESQVISGPCTEIGLDQGTAVLVIQIPQSDTAPHVHSDGRIYRRVADGSEPKPETDRFALDQLWKRGESIRKKMRKWVKNDPDFSKKEEGIPYVRLLLCPDPWMQRCPWLSAMFYDIRDVLVDLEENRPSVSFDVVHTTSGGIIARQVNRNDPWLHGLTWRMSRDLLCEFVFPLNIFTLSDSSDLDRLLENFKGYEYGKYFFDIMKDQKRTNARVVDLNFMMNLLTACVSKYQRFLNMVNWSKEFYFKARILNAWRVSPFVDNKLILDDFKKFGIPTMPEQLITVPLGEDPGTFYLVKEIEGIDSEEYQDSIQCRYQALAVFIQIVEAFGISVIFRRGEDIDVVDMIELEEAGDRATIVQNNQIKQ